MGEAGNWAFAGHGVMYDRYGFAVALDDLWFCAAKAQQPVRIQYPALGIGYQIPTGSGVCVGRPLQNNIVSDQRGRGVDCKLG